MVRHPTARRSTAEFLRPPTALRAKVESRPVSDAGLLTLSRRPLAEERDERQHARRSACCRWRSSCPDPCAEIATTSQVAADDSWAQDFIEDQSLGPMTLARYRVEIKQFLGHCDNQPSLRVQTQRGDETLARHFNTLFFRGHGISNAEQTLAGLTHFDARFSRIGTEALPKAVRSPRGWRRLTLPRSRKACALGRP